MSANTGYRQYLRKYRLLVRSQSGSGTDLTGLRCTFACEKSLNDTPNYSQIAVYNPSQATIQTIGKGDTVILEAGYENGNYGMIFTGQIVQPFVTREDGTDVVLNLIVQDADAYLTSSFTCKTIAKGATPEQVVMECLEGAVSRGLISERLAQSQLPRGRVLFGKSADYVSRIADGNQCQFYIEDGQANIVSASDYAGNQAVELNPATGLIGTPSQTDDGVSGQCLINPSIKLNTLVYINQKLVQPKAVSSAEDGAAAINTDGVYRVVKLTYEGDTRGDAWYCNFEAITQSGVKPDGLSGNETNPWR